MTYTVDYATIPPVVVSRGSHEQGDAAHAVGRLSRNHGKAGRAEFHVGVRDPVHQSGSHDH
ncbi:hypothetical protein ABZU86_28390 [Streptomyces sp. NPDC005271]|uniref:hypothetical protein n=1 Tax=unclassified Streptomyces TaxID=2593676 RepID=UPI0033B26FBE